MVEIPYNEGKETLMNDLGSLVHQPLAGKPVQTLLSCEGLAHETTTWVQG